MTEKNLTLDQWYKELECLANAMDCAWLLTGNKDDYTEGYSMGYSPEEELAEQISAAV